MISTIIFDLSEVYLRGMKGIEKQISDLTGQTVLDNKLFFGKTTEKFFHGKISEDEFWQIYIQENSWKTSIDVLKQLVRKNMTEIQGTRGIMEKLKENGYKLGLLSIHAKEWVEHCEAQYHYHQLFDARTYSYEIGISKPDPKAFLLLLDKLQAKPQESLFIDDYIVNVDAAKKLGLQAVQFITPEQLQVDLRNHDIRI